MQMGKQVDCMNGQVWLETKKKKVLSNLPKEFPNILETEHCDTISQIWKVGC